MIPLLENAVLVFDPEAAATTPNDDEQGKRIERNF